VQSWFGGGYGGDDMETGILKALIAHAEQQRKAFEQFRDMLVSQMQFHPDRMTQVRLGETIQRDGKTYVELLDH
jgi:hypothetical protein